MDKLTIILIVISAVIAVVTAYFQYFYKVKDKSQYLYWLSFFRAMALFTLLLLLINPSVQNTSYTLVKPKLNVVFDNSKSIEFQGNAAVLNTYLNDFRNSEELNDKFEMNFFKFGSKVQELDSLSFEDGYTNISKVFKTLSEIGNEGQEAVVLITDGNQTAGSNTFMNTSKSHVYPLIIGDTMVYEDVSIDRLNVNPTTFLNNNAPVEVFVNYTGNKTISKELSLYQDRIKIASKRLSLSKFQNAVSESFFIPALKEGKQYYSAQIETLEGEINTENNTKSFALNIIEEKAKILVLSEVVHPDLGMLKSSIETKKEREVVLKSLEDSFDIAQFDLVILYQPTSKFEPVFKRIIEDEINYMLISGIATDWNFLNRIQSNYSRETINSEEDFSAVFNEGYSTFLTEPLQVEQWPPLQHSYGKLKINPRFNTLLFQNIGGIITEEPLLGTFEMGNQKVGLWMGENAWRWRMYSFKETGSFEQFDGFMSNLIQYLSSKKQRNRLHVSHKELFYANESVEFTASYLDDNLNFDPKAQIEITVYKSNGAFTKTVPFTAYASTFKSALSDLSEGTYQYTIKVLGEAISKSGSFKVAAYNLEEQFSSAQWRKLHLIANETQGALYFQNNAVELLEDLKKDTRYKTIQTAKEEKIPLIEWRYLLMVIVVALGLEWFTRKYFGKI